jgi:hypothetical protein
MSWMSRSTPKMEGFAQRLVAHEAVGNKPFAANAPAAFGGVVAKLRQPLVALTGAGGFRSLLLRALALSSEEFRWVRAVHIRADGSLECPAEMAHLDRAEIAKGEVALLARLLQLLVTFVGEALTLGLLHDAWPEVPFNDFDSDKNGSKREET